MKTDLWSDKKFIEKRIKEQNAYLHDLSNRYDNEEISTLRFGELSESAMFVKRRFENRWTQLNERETIERLSDTANFIG